MTIRKGSNIIAGTSQGDLNNKANISLDNLDTAGRAILDAKANNSIVATGSTESRILADRFADVINVKDFGAKGDSITDDTNAFVSLENRYKNIVIDLNGETFKVLSIPSKNFYTNGCFLKDDIKYYADLQTYNIYVDSVFGNDNNNGDAEHPLATIQKAIDIVAIGGHQGKAIYINIAPGSYRGFAIRSQKLFFKTDGDVTFTTDCQLRNSSYLFLDGGGRFSNGDWVFGTGRYTFTGSISYGLYIYGDSEVLNATHLYFNSNERNGLCCDNGGRFASHEYDCEINFNCPNGRCIECSRSQMYLGILSGSGLNGIMSFGGIIKYYSSTLIATNLLFWRSDGGSIETENPLAKILELAKPSDDYVSIPYTKGSTVSYICPASGIICVSTSTSNATSAYTGTVENVRTNARIGVGGYGYGRGGGELSCKKNDEIRITVDNNVTVDYLILRKDVSNATV